MPELQDKFAQRSLAAGKHTCGSTIAGWLFHEGHSWHLRDQSGSLSLPCSFKDLDPKKSYWAVLKKQSNGWNLNYHSAIHGATPFQGDQASFNKQSRRFSILRAVRTFFQREDFMEVDTPIMVDCPAMEPYLDAFSCQGFALRTSPELHMKRLLCSGWDRIFQIAPSFRNEPESNLHHREFLMLEWYRSFAGLNTLVSDVESLFRHLAPSTDHPEYFEAPVLKLRIPQVFKMYTGIDLTQQDSRDQMVTCLHDNQIPVSSDDTWDDLYFKVFLNLIERKLGHDQPVLLFDYPASQSALAKKNPVPEGHYHSCFRFEVFVKGIECANAFYELCDPVEQRKRFVESNQERTEIGSPPHPDDPVFFDALNAGMPPSSGIALGLDRLIMIMLGQQHLIRVMPHYYSIRDQFED